MELTIILRKTIKDPEEGRQIFNLVKERLQDRQDVTVRGHTTKDFETEDEPQ